MDSHCLTQIHLVSLKSIQIHTYSLRFAQNHSDSVKIIQIQTDLTRFRYILAKISDSLRINLRISNKFIQIHFDLLIFTKNELTTPEENIRLTQNHFTNLHQIHADSLARFTTNLHQIQTYSYKSASNSYICTQI